MRRLNMKFTETSSVKKVIENGKEASRLFNPIILLIIAMFILFFAPIPAGILMIVMNTRVSPLVNNVVFTLIMGFACILMGIYLYVRYVEKRPFISLGFDKSSWITKYLKGYGFACITMTVIALIIGGLGEYRFMTKGVNVGYSMLPAILFTIIGWMVQGGTEEVLTRGWLMTSISARTNIYLGIVLNSGLFMIAHLFNNSISGIALINLFIFGIFASVYAINEGSLWAICGFHSGWNWFQGNILGIEVSGNPTIGGSLIKLIPGDVVFISGGSFGIEASIITTIVLVLCSVLYIYKIKRCH